MNLKRWLSVILMLGLVLALCPLAAQADPPYGPYYHNPHWDRGYGPRHYEREYLRRHCVARPVREVYVAPPRVALVAPVAPMMVPQPQPYYSQPSVPNGLHGSLTFGY